jgi:hypothetical protein
LKKKEVYAHSAPHLLTPDQKHQRAASPVKIVEMTYYERNVLKRIAMVDERKKTSECNLVESKNVKAQKMRMQKSKVKTMLTAIFYAKGIIHHEFVLEKQTVNSKFYKEVIKRLSAQDYHVRPELFATFLCGSPSLIGCLATSRLR